MTLEAQLLKQVSRLTALGQLTMAVKAMRALANEAETIAQGATSTRRARTPRSAKAKGRAGVVEARKWICTTFGLEEDDLQIQTTSVGGSDIHLSPAAKRVFPFAPEIKNVESLNVWKALTQAQVNADKRGLRPVLLFKRNASVLYIAVKVDDLPYLVIPKGPHGQKDRQEDPAADL